MIENLISVLNGLRKNVLCLEKFQTEVENPIRGDGLNGKQNMENLAN